MRKINNEYWSFLIHFLFRKGEVDHTVYAYVLDTGINPDHTDFEGRATPWYDAVADGRNGIDCNGHGTHCAGILGSKTYGVAKDTQIRMVRVLDCWGKGQHSTLLAGMEYIVANGDQPGVVSMSLISYGSRALDDGTQKLLDSGFAVAAAAGNRNRNACYYSPARVKGIMTVGATDFFDTRNSDSNYGKCVDIFAPGSYITSLGHDSTTATDTKSGTSMACPFVAGAAALLLGKDPSLTHAEVKSKIVDMSSKDKITDAGDHSPNRLLYINLSQ
ncbi:extracellular serine proteinase-like [Patiria miniata]|uniref:Peptidase S8/S53 domain-containing protein n=1 Tax=Patiria miniata TaxID=46514 RepID=A0A913ZS19_PATMI|nr:extracellular serine proteinase-like [Patiria miniata]